MRPASLASLRLCVLLAVLVAAPSVLAGPGPMLLRSSEGEALLDRGRAEMMAFRLDAAERTFEQLAALEPESPAAAFHLAKVAWWKAITLEQDALYGAFFERSDELIGVLRRAPDDPWTTHFRAETEMHRAVAHLRQESYTRAALALRQSHNHFNRNARRHPDFHESRWGIGIAYAAVGSVPRPYRGLLRVLGFRGTVPQGMQEIRAAADHSVYYRDEAAVIHALMDEAINEGRGNGVRRLQAVARQHPDSPVMGLVMGFALLKDRQAESAERVLLRANAARSRSGVYPLHQVEYFLAESIFRQNRFDEAATRFDRFLRNYPGPANRAQAALKAGLSREMEGDRAAALRYYRGVQGREDYDADEAAAREAERRIANPLGARERTLLLGQNAFDGGRYDEAVRLVQPILTDASAAPVQRAEAAYRSGRAFHVSRQWAEALRHYQYAVSNPGDPLAKWGPWSQFYIGEVHAAQGNREAAREAYQRALSNNDPFAYRKGLEQRARAALDQL